MDAQFWAIGFAILGFGLIMAEFFIPSGGMIALSCAASFVASVYCAYNAWYVRSPTLFWAFSLGLGVLIPSFLAFFLRILEKTPLGNNLLLPKPDPRDVVPYQDEAERLDRLIGRNGVAVTSMTPGGIVQVENQRLHAVSEGILLKIGDPVEITGVRGNCVVVRRARAEPFQPLGTAPSPPQPTVSEPRPVVPSPEERLDFDIPQD